MLAPKACLCLLLLSPCVQAQLPPLPVPAQNPITPAKAILGKALFWDEQLSSDDSIACGTCHVPEFGGGDPRFAAGMHPGPDGLFATADDIVGSPGVTRQDQAGNFTPGATFGLRRQATGRTANTNLGAAYHSDLFWDGRATSAFVDPETSQLLIPFGGALESQAVGPILSAVEMAQEGRTWQDVRSKLQQVVPLKLARNLTPDLLAALQVLPSYPALFAAAFGDPAITASRIAFALATYQRTLIPNDTPWDRYMAGQTAALTPAQQQGWLKFSSHGRCDACHVPPLFHDDQFHNLGLRFAQEDPGLGGVSQVPADDGSFKTATLRNAGLRPRLFHNGQSPALLDPAQDTDPASTLNIYLQGGGVDRSNVDPFVLPLHTLGVTAQDLDSIQHFVATALVDARAAQGLPPFDHPTLASLAAPPRQFGGEQGATGAAPFLIDTIPTYLGNGNWKLGIAASAAATLAYVGYGAQSLEPALPLAGMPLNVLVNDGRLLVLDATLGNAARATWRLPIPADPALTHIALYFQTWVLEQGPSGNAIASSKGVQFVLH